MVQNYEYIWNILKLSFLYTYEETYTNKRLISYLLYTCHLAKFQLSSLSVILHTLPTSGPLEGLSPRRGERA
jgi:hypothetical protein